MAPDAREAILVAAEEYLVEVGPVAFEVKELAQRADFNASLVNYHFGGKDGLVLEVANSVFKRNASALIERVERHSDPMEALAEFAQVMIDHTISYGAMAPLIGFQDAFATRVDPLQRKMMSEETLDAAERIGTTLFSVIYAISKRRSYRRLNRFRIAAVAATSPTVMDTVSLVGFSVGGFPQVWAQYQAKPIFGFDPAKRLKRAILRLGSDLAKQPVPESDDTGFYE